jgi:hypothetical protein
MLIGSVRIPVNHMFQDFQDIYFYEKGRIVWLHNPMKMSEYETGELLVLIYPSD